MAQTLRTVLVATAFAASLSQGFAKDDPAWPNLLPGEFAEFRYLWNFPKQLRTAMRQFGHVGNCRVDDPEEASGRMLARAYRPTGEMQNYQSTNIFVQVECFSDENNSVIFEFRGPELVPIALPRASRCGPELCSFYSITELGPISVTFPTGTINMADSLHSCLTPEECYEYYHKYEFNLGHYSLVEVIYDPRDGRTKVTLFSSPKRTRDF